MAVGWNEDARRILRCLKWLRANFSVDQGRQRSQQQTQQTPK